ncbi:bifunctional phosphoribosylaminoimidazolecarboxamide formyltransferase/IMP cyclohydrolase [Litoreibacter roseus]|uniref:Bifunctional purine biosynthesis protein PurH n=1 Tax=Litoreibacter roseus TaxID=2601869 RepID=A0A6N6JM96_9RHOB|nr:bifunctional phosphoribosylaminoimidazolecarboxamide formyltransferase/IMP cyclohydrolase [Litoreibacter roseus]GFE66312.1 bifunctional purine biosynthesis protein PurH [Litoreibacter roseus]
MTDLVRVRRALLSVSDKAGLIDLAQALSNQGVELLSTGGTAQAIRDAGLKVRDVSEVTGFPEMMDGRVKTLHPIVHGGLLALRDNSDHTDAMDAHGIGAIDLLVVNLYPFEETVAKGADYQMAIENIDIGGPAMLRSAAKNHQFVNVVTDVEDYEALLSEMAANEGATRYAFRQRLALTAYGRTAAYDTAVSTWLATKSGTTARRQSFTGTLSQTLRYGENPHQGAAFYVDGTRDPSVATATQLQGKELSYNNINDTDAAFQMVAEFDPAVGPACAIIKHANPCGVARGETLREAYANAFRCDQTSAFGGIVALNQPLDGETADEIAQIFTEVVIAPGADQAAREVFAAKKNLRLLITDGLPDQNAGLTFKQVAGGILVQDKDVGRIEKGDLKTVTKRAPNEQEMEDLLFAWTVAKHVKSNAIVYAKNGATVGIGAGQMSRVDSTRIAARKALDMADVLKLDRSPTQGAAVASDAFFPFADGLITAAEAGATALIQPGGSMRDEEVIAAADELGLAMVFTGMRHFRH